MSTRWFRALLLAGSAFLSGCSLFSGDSRVKAAELSAFDATAEIVEAWQGSAGKAGNFSFTPAVVEGSVYAAGHGGTLVRFDNGREIWRISVGERLSGGVGSDGQLVAVGTAKGEVLVFDAETADLLWRSRLSTEILAAPAIGEGLVVVRTGDSRIAGLDAKDGNRRWVFQRTAPTLNLRTNVGVLLGQKVVVAGLPGGKLVAINNQTGAAIWDVTVALPKGATELERVADLASTPVVRGRDICAAAFQGRVACFDIATGNMKWARDISSSAGIDMDDKRVYVSDDKGNVHAFSRESGASIWKQDKLFMRRLSRPIALGKHVAVGDFEGIVHLLDAETGTFAARIKTDGSAIQAEPQRLDDGGFVVQTMDGGVFALRPR